MKQTYETDFRPNYEIYLALYQTTFARIRFIVNGRWLPHCLLQI